MATKHKHLARGVRYFVIKSVDGSIRFQSNFGDGPAQTTGGYGGWQITARPRDLNITEWKGRDPIGIDIPFFLDYFLVDPDDKPGIDCENQIANLERLCGVGHGGAQPPICIVDGGGAIPHDRTTSPSLRWVVENITWDKGLEARSSSTGRRIRAGGTIAIRQFVQATGIFRTIGPNSRASIPKNFIVTKHYNTLGKIAALYYDDSSKWTIIADANHIRDHRHLKIGQHLRIPTL